MLKLTVLSPERRLLDGVSTSEVTLVGEEGQIQILPGHAPMLGTLETGAFRYLRGSEEAAHGLISSGFFEVRDDQVTLLAETLELEGEVDLDRARRAQQTAERVLSEAELDEHRFKKYQLKLQRSLVRQQFVGRSS